MILLLGRFTDVIRNLGIISGMTVAFGAIHILASEYIKTQKSKGEVLLFKRGRKIRYLTQLQHTYGEEANPSTFAQDFASRRGSMRRTGDDITNVSVSENKPITATIQGQSATFHWSHLKYEIKTRDGTRCILNNIDGWVKPGTLTMMMVSL